VAVPVFTQNVIAVIWDFDKTLLPTYMQSPLFERYGVDEDLFWKEVRTLPSIYAEHGSPLISVDTMYLNHVLTYVRAGIFGDLNNAVLRGLGGKLDFYPGMPEFLEELRAEVEEPERFKHHDVTLEHYIISTGFRQTILGSKVAPFVKQVWGCEFLEAIAQPGYLEDPARVKDEAVLQAVAYHIDNTTKTRAIFEINKGANEYPEEIDVNATIALEDRRVPFENMIYIADGPSDVPVFSILNHYGGKTLAVYNPDSDAEFEQVAALRDQRRVQDTGPADYTSNSHTAKSLKLWTRQIAGAIVERREQRLRASVGASPRHLAGKQEVMPAAAEAPRDAIERSALARSAVEPATQSSALDPPVDRRRTESSE
jgi:hypothetical protein